MKVRCLRLSMLATLVLLFALPALADVTPPQAQLNYDNRDGKLILKSAESAVDLVIPADVNGYPVTEIAGNAFWDSPNLRSVSIPKSIGYISSDAFSYCEQLAEIVVDEANPNYSATGGGLYDKPGSTLLLFAQGASGEVVMPEGLRYVDAGAFENCTLLTGISFREGLIEIGSDAFLKCAALKRMDLPATLEILPQDSPFLMCPSLAKINVAKGNPNFVSKDGALYDSEALTLIAHPGASGKVKVPDSVTRIGSSAFANAQGMIELELPIGLYELDAFALLGCTGLKRVDIPDGTALIGRNAFEGCDQLELIAVPSSVVSIGDSAFPKNTAIQCASGSVADQAAQTAGLRRLLVDPETGEVHEPAAEGDAPEGMQTPDAEDVYVEILQALNDELIKTTYAYLAQGNTVSKGAKTQELRGLQQLLNLLGASLTVDGSIGEKSIAALNLAQEQLALVRTENVSQKEFEELLIGAIASLNLGDSRTQDESQAWPPNGPIYQNSDLNADLAQLTIKTSLGDDMATYLKMYAQDGQLALSAFIAGTGEITLMIPMGSYSFKVGTGTTWFGEDQAFGHDIEASYSQLTFASGEVAQFRANYRYTLALGGSTDINVGSKPVDAGDF